MSCGYGRNRKNCPFNPRIAARSLPSLDGGWISSDAGAVLPRSTNQLFGVTGRLAACFSDYQSRERIERPLEALIGQQNFWSGPGL